ncbi:hypothetical protein JYU23_00145 [bacterium AH-315-C07]|nr:hypothetical protein [bacterium AH-315-C07]
MTIGQDKSDQEREWKLGVGLTFSPSFLPVLPAVTLDSKSHQFYFGVGLPYFNDVLGVEAGYSHFLGKKDKKLSLFLNFDSQIGNPLMILKILLPCKGIEVHNDLRLILFNTVNLGLHWKVGSDWYATGALGGGYYNYWDGECYYDGMLPIVKVGIGRYLYLIKK